MSGEKSVRSGGGKKKKKKKNEVKKRGCDFMRLLKFRTKIGSSSAVVKNPEGSEDLASRKSRGAIP